MATQFRTSAQTVRTARGALLEALTSHECQKGGKPAWFDRRTLEPLSTQELLGLVRQHVGRQCGAEAEGPEYDPYGAPPDPYGPALAALRGAEQEPDDERSGEDIYTSPPDSYEPALRRRREEGGR